MAASSVSSSAIENGSIAATAATPVSTPAASTTVRDVTRDVFAATLGSAACCCVGQPFDTVKVRLQTNPALFPTPLAAVRLTVRREGAAALWRGAVPTLLGMTAETALAFALNEQLKRSFPEPGGGEGGGRPGLVRPFCTGLFSGCAAAFVLNPAEVVKARAQVSTCSASGSSRAVFARMVSDGGGRASGGLLKSLYAGFDGQLARDGLYFAVFFGSYDLTKHWFATNAPSMPDEVNYFISGGLAGMIGWTVAMPFDVPKTNIQSRSDGNVKVLGSYWPEMKRIVRTRGWGGLFRGLGPTLVRAFPANAALFLGLESGKKFFDEVIWRV